MGETWDGKTFSATLDANSAAAVAAVGTAEQAGQSWAGKNYNATLGANTADLVAGRAQAEQITDSVAAMSADVRFTGDESDVRRAAISAIALIAGVPNNHDTVFNGEAEDLIAAAMNGTAATKAVPNKKTTVFDGRGEQLLQVVSRAMAQLRMIPRLISIALVLGPDPTTALKMINQELRRVGSPRKINLDSGDVRKAAADMNIFQRAAIKAGNALGTLMNVGGSDGSMARRFGRMAAATMGAGQALTRLANGAERTSPALAAVIDMASRGVAGMRRFGGALRTAGTNLATFGNASSRTSSTLSRLMSESERGPSIFTRMGGALRTGATAMGGMAAAGAAAALSLAGITTSGTQIAAMASNLIGRIGGLSGAFSALLNVAMAVASAVLSVAATFAAITAVVTLLATLFAAFVAVLTVATAGLAALGIGFGLAAAAALRFFGPLMQVQQATQRVKDAQIALNAARKSGDPKRIEEAERELAQALNAADVAARKAAGGSRELGKAMQDVVREAGKLKDSFNKAFASAATEIGQISTEALKLANSIMPQLGQAADTSLKRLQIGFQQSHNSSTQLNDILIQIPPIMEDLGAAAGNFGSAFSSMMEVVLPYVKQFTQWVQEASKELATWADSQAGRDQIREFLDAAVPIVKALYDAFVELGGELLKLAQEHGPAIVEAIDSFSDAASAAISAASEWADEILAVVDAAMKAVEWVGNLIEAMGKVPGGGGMPGQGGTGGAANPTWAYGGDQAVAMARGGNVGGGSGGGAHHVDGPTWMNVGGTDVLYGEALSGNNREYAFPLDGGWRFITEEPGFDANSFALWQDLGKRKGFMDAVAGSKSSPGAGGSKASGGGSPAIGNGKNPNVSHTTTSISGGDTPAGWKLEHTVEHKTAKSSSGGDPSRRIESALKKHEDRLADLLKGLRGSTDALPERIKNSVNHILESSKDTRLSVVKGLSRESFKRAFEGSF